MVGNNGNGHSTLEDLIQTLDRVALLELSITELQYLLRYAAREGYNIGQLNMGSYKDRVQALLKQRSQRLITDITNKQ